MTAASLSPEEAAVAARFDAAPVVRAVLALAEELDHSSARLLRRASEEWEPVVYQATRTTSLAHASAANRIRAAVSAALDAQPVEDRAAVVERAARAMYERYHEPFSTGEALWPRASNQEEWRDMARAALAAAAVDAIGGRAT